MNKMQPNTSLPITNRWSTEPQMVALGNAMVADTALVQRAQADDRAAFNEIVLRYKSKVYNFIHRMIPSMQDAEDLTQETFVRAYLSIRSFQSRAGLNTWLFRIATNLCIDYGRRAKKTQGMIASLSHELEDDEAESQRDIPDLEYDPQRLLLNKELGTQLEK